MIETNTTNCPHQHEQIYHFGRGGSDPEHQAHQADIAALLTGHHLIERQVTLLANGFSAMTTSDDPSVVAHLQTHVRDMKARFDKGRAIRSWDPVYALLFAYRDQIQVQYESIARGVSSTVTTDQPQLVELLHAHAAAVSGFVRDGKQASGQSYPVSETLAALLVQYAS